MPKDPIILAEVSISKMHVVKIKVKDTPCDHANGGIKLASLEGRVIGFVVSTVNIARSLFSNFHHLLRLTLV